MKLSELAEKASTNRLYRRFLSYQLNRVVPFNAPHRLKVAHISNHSLTLYLPYRRRNRNHLKGIHACAMATIAEATSGFLLISRLDPRQFRLILQSLNMDYQYQAKTAVKATFDFDQDWWQQNVLAPLKKESKVVVPCTVRIDDMLKNQVATGTAHWQIKDWQQVKSGRP